MYRTDHAHQWERTSYMPMSSAYARTLYDEAALLMTGDTRPAPFGHTKDGDLVEVRRSGFAVDINTDAVPLDEIDARIMPLAPSAPLRQQCRGQSCSQGREPCAHPHLCMTDESLARVTSAPAAQKTKPPAVQDNTPQHYWSRAADWAMLALAVGTAAGWLLAKVFA